MASPLRPDKTVDPFVSELRQRRDMYYRNALDALNKLEYAKAAELMWGTVTQQCIITDYLLPQLRPEGQEPIGRAHRQYRDFCKNLTLLTGERSFVERYNSVQSLHSYFYREDAIAAPEVTFETIWDSADELIKSLEDLINRWSAKP